MRYRVTFEEIKWSSEKRFTCSCGRNLRRRRTFMQTLNPYNKKADGSVKTEADILSELRAEALAWREKKEPCLHAGEIDMNVPKEDRHG